MRGFIYIIRKITRGFVCLQENGWRYTWYHGVEKIGRWLFLYSRRAFPYCAVRRKTISKTASFAASGFANVSKAAESRTVACFALYAPSGRIPDSTWLYLKGLAEAVDDIIVCGDCTICQEDIEKMKSFATCAMFERHEGYDFGSYARAYRIAAENGYLKNCNKLVLANDSCVGPVFPLSDMFNAMSQRQADFWGQTSWLFHGKQHVQSYFMVFSKKIIEIGVLRDFFSAMIGYSSRKEVIKNCEIGLTDFLIKHGFAWDSFVPYGAFRHNPTVYPDVLLKRYACPLIKIKALKGEAFEPVEKALETIKRTNKAVFDAYCAIADDWEPLSGL